MGRYGQHRTYGSFELRFYFPELSEWIDLTIKDCISFQNFEASRKKTDTAPQLGFAETVEGFNYRTRKDTKGPTHPSSKKWLSFCYW